MQAVELRDTGSFEGLEVVERPRPNIGPCDVLVRIHAASLNYRDLLLPLNRFPVPGDYRGRVPLSDGAGEVVAIGSMVRRFKVGDRVASNAVTTWIAGPIRPEHVAGNIGFFIDGMLAEFVALHEDALVLLPGYLSYAEAAALPCAAVSAWSCLTGGPRGTLPGDTVLVQGTGGVSLFALQFAKMFGARVIATTSSTTKMATLEALGADVVINYHERPDWDAAVLDATGNRGVDRVIEVGGASTIERSTRCTRFGGIVSCVGFVGGHQGGVDPLFLISRVLSLQGYMMGSRIQFEEMLKAMELHELHPVIDSTFDIGDTALAYHHLHSGRHVGKIVIQLDQGT
jgi:NADPH:quinone reductase-like Zn-dependent oxidoreductase